VGYRLAVLLAGAAMASAVLAVGFLSGSASAQAADPRPNILLVVTDDLDDRADSIARMESLRSLVTNRGVTFRNAYVTQALCCPSRASMLRGQYPHNTGVVDNNGEYGDFVSSGREANTFATWVNDAGYQTAYFGKYLNGYNTTRIPAGWDRWFSDMGRSKLQNFNDQGRKVFFNPRKHLFEDVLRDNAIGWLRQDRDPAAPFLAVLSTHAPHSPAVPARRHADLFPGADLPRPESFNEKKVDDKNGWIRRLDPLQRDEIGEMETLYRNRLRVMEGVDEMLEDVLLELRAQGELENTYVFFTSDNGFHFGEHRFHQGKQTSYEEDIAVPMIVSGPGVAAGVTRQQIVLNQDLAPTFAEIAGATVPPFVDARSFLPVLGDAPPAASQWRDAFLVNSPATNATGWLKTMPNNLAVRTPRYELIDYARGTDELYDMDRDPHQAHSIISSPPAGVLDEMRANLADLRNCAGQECVAAEGP
jgi:N-acetylglucosamine-6-sulfatase